MTSVGQFLLPSVQRRSVEELVDQLDFSTGENTSKRSAFWIMLVLAGVIATAGVLADSTATVIGAMIIAPLSTPIMGIGLGIVSGRGSLVGRSLLYVLGGLVAVVAIGAIASFFVPSQSSLLENSQVLARTAPALVDLVAALATGFAGAIALCRRDVGSILPGVAIAISLVPPLGVVGVCLGRGELALAFGALVLFVSNVIALVIAGCVVFTVSGYARSASTSGRRGRAYFAIAGVLAVVLIPLAANTASVVLVTQWTSRIQAAANHWIIAVPHSEVDGVTWDGLDAVVTVRSPRDDLKSVAALRALLKGQIPDSVHVTVNLTNGEVIPVE